MSKFDPKVYACYGLAESIKRVWQEGKHNEVRLITAFGEAVIKVNGPDKTLIIAKSDDDHMAITQHSKR